LIALVIFLVGPASLLSLCTVSSWSSFSRTGIDRVLSIYGEFHSDLVS
jgi:hypothetical protein